MTQTIIVIEIGIKRCWKTRSAICDS